MSQKLKELKYSLDHDNVLIYQMGKVGSTSIQKALDDTEYYAQHTHSYYSPIDFQMFKKFKSVKHFRPLKSRIKFRLVGFVKKCVINSKKEIKIISLVREPVSRNISIFFQDIHIPIAETRLMFDIRSENPNILLELFFQKVNHKYGINWFDNEFEKTFGINVYDYEFDREKGIAQIKKDNIRLLIVKMEKLKDLEADIGQFLNLKDFKISNNNRGSNKWYSELYKKFKEDFVANEEYVDMLYNSKYMKHFYSDREIVLFKSQWLKVKNEKSKNGSAGY